MGMTCCLFLWLRLICSSLMLSSLLLESCHVTICVAYFIRWLHVFNFMAFRVYFQWWCVTGFSLIMMLFFVDVIHLVVETFIVLMFEHWSVEFVLVATLWHLSRSWHPFCVVLPSCVPWSGWLEDWCCLLSRYSWQVYLGFCWYACKGCCLYCCCDPLMPVVGKCIRGAGLVCALMQ